MNVTVKELLDAGLHIGHQLKRFNPKSRKYVYDNHSGISIIDLGKTHTLLSDAVKFIEDLIVAGKNILFVGTKKQAQEFIREAAISCNSPYCASRWLGGTLTNFATIKKSIEKYKRYLSMEEDGSLEKLPNKEESSIRREMNRMNRNFEGIVNLTQLPAALFIVDINHQAIAVAEANRLGIPIVALVDTNSNPDLVDYPIPGNDDSTKSLELIINVIMEAVQSGQERKEEEKSSLSSLKPLINESINEGQLPVTTSSYDEDSGVPEHFSSDND